MHRNPNPKAAFSEKDEPSGGPRCRTLALIATLAVLGIVPISHMLACKLALLLFPTLILFYTGVVVLMAVAGLTALGVATMVHFLRPSCFAHVVPMILNASVVASSLTLCVFVLGPVTVDRSISTFLLSRLSAARDPGLTPSDLLAAFQDEYVLRHHAIERRLREQLAGGTIQTTPECKYVLTSRGRCVLAFMRLLTDMYGVQDTYVRAPARSKD